MTSEWRCGECEHTGTIESDRIHGPQLLIAIRQQHRSLSPECRIEDPIFYPIGPLPHDKRPTFLNQLSDEVTRLELAVKADLMDPTFLAVVKNEIVWLDCQLGTDGESVEILKQLEVLRVRVDDALALKNKDI